MTEFIQRHIGITETEQAQMLKDLGLSSLEELVREIVPTSILLRGDDNLPEPCSEQQALEELKKLLADAGYPNGFDVELRCPNDRYVNDEAICTAVVGMLGKIGVNVNLFAQTKSKHFKELKDDQGDFYMLGWGVPTLDSHYVFHYLYETGASWNKVNFSNADVDAAIRVMEGEVDLDKRNAAIAKAWKIVKDDISYLPLHHQVISWASKSNVNVPIRPNNEPLFRTASFN